MPKKKEYCKHCGSAIMKHRHTFSKVLANLLLKAANKFKEGIPFHLQNGLNLSKNEYNNFQKLKYWGLIWKCYENGKRKGGYWRLGPGVRELINGGLIAEWVKTYNNQVIESSTEAITLAEATGGYETPEQWANKSEVMEGVGQPELFKTERNI